MSRRGLIGSAVVATLMAGCGVAGQVDEGQDPAAAEGAFKVRCPDPNTDCTVSNGAGIYTEEQGFAGIGPRQFMITHFTNVAGGVQVTGRYYDAPTNSWQTQTGTVYYANYAGKTSLPVRGITEGNTVPVWTLFDASTSSNITVADSGLLNLEVVLRLPNEKLYTIDWDAVATETMKAPIRKYNMRWRVTGAATPTQYCLRANASKDDVVFQQGMIVNPGNAMVTRDATTAGAVTLSCRYGAMATVRLWGYPYRGAPSATYYFDAGLHMKRASYCADGSYFTHAGTRIRIRDDKGMQSDPMSASEIEAWWTPSGATCIGPLRHAAMGFTGWCGAVHLPPCSAAPGGHLADAASPPGP